MKTSYSTYSDPQFMTIGFEVEGTWNANELKFFTLPLNLPPGFNHPFSASIGKLGGTDPSYFIVYFNGFVTDGFVTNGVQIGVRNISSTGALADCTLQVQINVTYH